MTGVYVGKYIDLELIREKVQRGDHRGAVGGLWDEIGHSTLDYLVDHGLTPDMYVLDIGCGCLRVGIHLVDVLRPQHYFGIDISPDLLDAGYDIELSKKGLQCKLARSNLLCDADFNFDRLHSPRLFDMALAQSVFTHLPLGHITSCMVKLTSVVAPGGRLFATVFHCTEDRDWSRPMRHDRGGITTYPARNPYHYRSADLRRTISNLPWTLSEPMDWDHPRDQAMAIFTRTDE